MALDVPQYLLRICLITSTIFSLLEHIPPGSSPEDHIPHLSFVYTVHRSIKPLLAITPVSAQSTPPLLLPTTRTLNPCISDAANQPRDPILSRKPSHHTQTAARHVQSLPRAQMAARTGAPGRGTEMPAARSFPPSAFSNSPTAVGLWNSPSTDTVSEAAMEFTVHCLSRCMSVGMLQL